MNDHRSICPKRWLLVREDVAKCAANLIAICTVVLRQTWQYGVNRRCAPPPPFFCSLPPSPVLEYAGPVWDACSRTDSLRLDLAQLSVARAILRASRQSLSNRDFFLAQTKGRREKERERKKKGKEEEGKEKGKGEMEREIGSEALAETEKIANAPAGTSQLGRLRFFPFLPKLHFQFPFPFLLSLSPFPPLPFPSSSFPFPSPFDLPFSLKNASSHLSHKQRCADQNRLASAGLEASSVQAFLVLGTD